MNARSRPPSAIERSFYAHIIATLADERMKRGWPQTHLDHLLGVSDGQVAKWEAFFRLPSAFMLTCWANALNVELAVVAARTKGE